MILVFFSPTAQAAKNAAKAFSVRSAISTGLFVGTPEKPMEIFRFEILHEGKAARKNVEVLLEGEAFDPPSAAFETVAPGQTLAVFARVPANPKGSGHPIARVKATVKYKKGRSETVESQTLLIQREQPGWTFHLTSYFTVGAEDGPEAKGKTAAALDLLDRYIAAAEADGRFTFALDQAYFLKSYMDLRPWNRERLKKLMARGQAELTGGLYAAPLMSAASGESLIRNLTYGLDWEEAVMGQGRVRSGWLPMSLDLFPQAPQIFASAGLRSAVFRGGPGANGPMDAPWRGLDGSALDAVDLSAIDFADASGSGFQRGGLNDLFDGWSLDRIQGTETTEFAAFLRAVMGKNHYREAFLPIGGELAEPKPWLGALADYWNDKYVSPKIRFSIPKEYFKARETAEKTGKTNWRVGEGMASGFPPVYPGTFFSEKQFVGPILFRAGNELIRAESHGAIAALLGEPFPGNILDRHWRRFIHEQQQDRMVRAGGQNAVEFKDGKEDGPPSAMTPAAPALPAILEVGRIQQNSILRLADGIHTGAGGKDAAPIILFNPSFFDREELVDLPAPDAMEDGRLVDSGNREIPFERFNGRILFSSGIVPGGGYKTFYLNGDRPSTLRDSFETYVSERGIVAVENEYLRVEADPSRGGAVARVTDKRSGREILPNAAGVEFRSVEDEGGALQFHPGKVLASLGGGKAKVHSRKNAMYESLIVDCKMSGGAGVRQTVTVRPGSRKIDFALAFAAEDFTGGKAALQIVVPFEPSSGRFGAYQTQFGAGEDLGIRQAPFHGWSAVSDGKTGIALVSGSHGSVSIDKERGELSWTFARGSFLNGVDFSLIPFEGDWRDARLSREAEAFARPLDAVATTVHPGRFRKGAAHFVRFESDTLDVSAFKVKSSGISSYREFGENAAPRLIVRLYDPAGRGGKGTLEFFPGLSAASARRTDATERKILGETPVRDGKVYFDLKPFEIQTHLIELDDPLGIAAPRNAEADGPEAGGSRDEAFSVREGTEAAGYMPVALKFEKDAVPPAPSIGVRLFVSNDDPRRRAAGTVKLAADDENDWAVIPSSIAYSLPPSGSQAFDVTVLSKRKAPRTGRIRAALMDPDNPVYDEFLLEAPPR